MAIKYSSIGGGTGTGFNVQVGSQYSYATFTQAQPAGAYTIKSSNNYTNWDIYLLDASNNLVAYTGSASIAPTTAFSAIMVVNGTLNDILQFSFASTVFSTATTSQTKAGPFITAFGSSVIPSVNSAVTITGGNFAVGITATFTGTDSVVRTCKSVVYTSSSSISVVRPDVLPIGFAPYVLTLTNPGINNPVTSGKNILTGLTVGNAPSWTTGASLPAASGGTAYSTTLVATDTEGAVTYSYVSGSLPAGLSFNASTGVISGTYNGLTDGSVSYTVRATDNGGNYIDRTFTIAYTGIGGGTLTSDATYYYRVFTGNGTLSGVLNLTADIFTIAGGGGGGYRHAAGAGAGGLLYQGATTFTGGSYTVTVGGGGFAGNSSTPSGGQGINTTFVGTGLNLIAVGGGGGSSYDGGASYVNGGCGGGADSSHTTPGTGVPGQGFAGGGITVGSNSYPYSHAGGGGTGAVGANGNLGTGIAGVGGDGTNAYSAILTGITSVMSGVSGWSTATSSGRIGGGGGGGGHDPAGNPGGFSAGGSGGGGRGGTRGSNTPGYDGITNTGSGGGGAATSSGGNSNGGAGGSGLVVVRYTRAQVGG